MSKFLLTLAFVVTVVSPSGATTCQDVLGSNVYSCHIKSSFASDFMDCFRFTSPGTLSPEFDLASDGLGASLGCACKVGGSLTNPKFNASKDFNCVTDASGGFSFSGKASGTKLKKGQVVSKDGNTFIYECVLSPVCPPAASTHSPSENPYTRP